MLLDNPGDHAHIFWRKNKIESTCEKEGTVEAVCVICGETRVMKSLLKGGHTYNEFDEFSDDPGFVVRKCLKCNKVVSRSRIVPLEACEENDAVYFGEWKQPFFDTEKKPLIWRVVEKRDGFLFLMLLGDRIKLPFDWSTQPTNVWKNCTLRRWLNKEFYDTAFTGEEKARMAFLNPDGNTSIVNTSEASGADRLTLPTEDYTWDYIQPHNHYSLNKEVFTKTVPQGEADSICFVAVHTFLNTIGVNKVCKQTPIIAVDMDDSRVKEKQYDKYNL